jgi:midasin
VETLKLAQLDAERVFEWHDGILVEAMRDGGLLLIDEISLANDSVLERLNSVLERERTLTLTEQSAAEAIKIQA